MTHDKYKWQVIASDFNSPFFRNYIFTIAPQLFPKLFDLPIPRLGILSKENAINYIAEMESWTAAHEALKEKVLKDFSFVEKLIDDTNSFGEAFNTWSEQEIFKADLEKKSLAELTDLLRQFSDRQATLYSYGITLPILDFLGFSFIERTIEAYLRSKVPDSEYQSYFDIFTYPLHNSFAQNQEEALLKLMVEFYHDQWKADVLEKSAEEISRSYPEFYAKLRQHTADFSWVYYVYAGPAFTEKQFLGFIKDYLSKGIDPRQKLAELEGKRKKADLLREEAIIKLKPDQKSESFLRLAGKMVWAKPRRKDLQSRSYYQVEKLHRELAKRTFLSLSQIRSLPIGVADASLANSIYKVHLCLPNDGEVVVLSGKEANEFQDKCLEKEAEKNYSDIREIKCQVASPGKKSGKVKIINRSEDMEKMEQGDILVSVATTPSIVPAMKKAGAIITDEGGLTCHAAIVSRELGITCVIGAKIATKVLKDGDLVEVDADKGVVRIINK